MVKTTWLERMIIELYENIIQKENLSNFNIFIDDYKTFEEIPLISRYEHLSFLSKIIPKEDFQFFLINTAVFLLNSIDLYAKNVLSLEEYKKYFICITFYDFEDIGEFGYVIPNFFVTRKKKLLSFLKNQQCGASENKAFIVSAFTQLGLDKFRFIELINQNIECDDFIRLYAIDHRNRKKLS